MPLLDGPQRGAHSLCQQAQRCICLPTQPGLQESITKCQGEAAPQGAITEGHLDELEHDCVFFCPIVSGIIAVGGKCN